MPALNKLYQDYRDRAAFYIVYIQEAHPIDAWQVDDNLEEDSKGSALCVETGAEDQESPDLLISC